MYEVTRISIRYMILLVPQPHASNTVVIRLQDVFYLSLIKQGSKSIIFLFNIYLDVFPLKYCKLYKYLNLSEVMLSIGIAATT